MRRLCFLIALLLGCAAMQAQTPNGKKLSKTKTYLNDHNVYYGLRLGMAISTLSGDNSNYDCSSAETGILVGGLLGFQLSSTSPVYIEAGLSYIEKGGKNGRKLHPDTEKPIDYGYTLNYLEAPVVVKYKIDLDGDCNVEPLLGGYLAYGIGGSYRDHTNRVSCSSYDSTHLSRFDAGVRIGCGFSYDVLYAELTYDWGLMNVCRDDFDKSTNGCFAISVGVNF